MMSGVPIGGSIAAVVGIVDASRRSAGSSMYLFAFSGFVLLAARSSRCSRSRRRWLRAQGRVRRGRRRRAPLRRRAWSSDTGPEHRPGFRTILRPPFARCHRAVRAGPVATLLAWYGLGTWLPKLMAGDARFDLGQPADLPARPQPRRRRRVRSSPPGPPPASARCPAPSARRPSAAAGLAFLVTYPSSVTLVYAALILAGVGTHGTQCLIISAVATPLPGPAAAAPRWASSSASAASAPSPPRSSAAGCSPPGSASAPTSSPSRGPRPRRPCLLLASPAPRHPARLDPRGRRRARPLTPTRTTRRRHAMTTSTDRLPGPDRRRGLARPAHPDARARAALPRLRAGAAGAALDRDRRPDAAAPAVQGARRTSGAGTTCCRWPSEAGRHRARWAAAASAAPSRWPTRRWAAGPSRRRRCGPRSST